ncbi:MAG: methylated-DNA--[protein]-cysteine S-methyltransferase [Gammaproteobacteria bacterium]
MNTSTQQKPLFPSADGSKAVRDYQRVAEAIRYLAQHRHQQPELGELARQIGLSPFHLQRLFVRWAGVSPKQFLSYLTVEHAKQLLREERSVLDAALESGLSGPGRLHDQFVTLEAMTPGEYKRCGAQLTLSYGVHPTPFGLALVLLTGRGICGLRFLEPGEERAALEAARAEWPASRFVEAPGQTAEALKRILAPSGSRERLLVRGSRLQIQVWRALLAIPPGRVVSYGALAEALGHPRAGRAIGTAIGANPVALIIPCHRVLRANGAITGYRWGAERKAAMIAWETARQRGGAIAQNPGEY